MNNAPSTSAKPSAKKPSAPPPPRWWSPSMSFWFVLGFAGLAAMPYLTSATKLMAEGKGVSAEALVKEVKMKEGQKKKDSMHREEPEKLREIKGLAVGADGTVYGGGKSGLYTLEKGIWTSLKGFEGYEVKSIATTAEGSLHVVHHEGVATRKADGTWNESYEGEAHSVAAGADGSVYVTAFKPARLLKLQADGSWEKLNDGLPTPDGEPSTKSEKEEPKKQD